MGTLGFLIPHHVHVDYDAALHNMIQGTRKEEEMVVVMR